MNIAIIVGINTDAISEERFPKWLEDIDDKTFNENWDRIYGKKKKEQKKNEKKKLP